MFYAPIKRGFSTNQSSRRVLSINAGNQRGILVEQEKNLSIKFYKPSNLRILRAFNTDKLC